MSIEQLTYNSLSNPQLNLTPISSFNTFTSLDQNDLSLTGSSSTLNADTTGNYNSTSGYGLVNAAAAVSNANGETTYADVPQLGGNNWGADLVKAPEVWAHGYTGKGVVVAVLDTGVDYNHEDLKNNIWTNTKEIAGNGIDDDGNGYIDDVSGWNFADKNNNILDKNGHGTHVSGTIAGENNNYGVTGIAYDAKIMPVKVLNDSGSGSYNSISKGIHYAVDNGANVINLSLGGAYSNRTMESAIDYASSKGVIVVMAAGNDGDSSPDYPARYAYKSGIAVGAVDRNNNMPDFSNRSGANEISYVTAPGVKVYSSVPNNEYAVYSGTSMATPHVAGVVALMLSANHNLTDAQVRQIITQTAGNNTQSTNSSLNLSDVSSVTSQGISDNNLLPINTQTLNNLTSQKNFSFNSSNFSSLIGQTITETAKYLTPDTISSFNNSGVGSLIGKTITEAVKYLTPDTISSFNNSGVGSLVAKAITETTKYVTSGEGNNGLANPELGSQFQNYDKILGVINVDSNSEDGNNVDFGKLLEGMQKQINQYKKFFGIA